MGILTVVFGILSGCLLSVLVGIIGSSRRIGFGWAFLISLIFTPLVGLIVALLTDPLPGGDRRWAVSARYWPFWPGLPRGVPPAAAHGRRARAWGMLSLSYFDEILLFRNIFAIMGKHIV